MLSSWATVASLPTARAALAAATGLDGRIYAMGGFSAYGGFVNTVEAYNAITNTWSTVAPMPTARADLAATTGADGRIYAIGGVNFSGLLSTVEVYNPTTNNWTTAASLPGGRQSLAAATGADGRIYVMGGAGGGNVVEAYSPSTNSWSTVANIPTSRFDLSAASGQNGRIYAMGGEMVVTQTIGTNESYSPATNSWSAAAAMPTARSSFGAATGTDGRIYTIGGLGPVGLVNTVEAYDPNSNAWASLPPMPTIRNELAAALGPDGRIYAIGGGSVASPLSTVEALTYVAPPPPRVSNTGLVSNASSSTHGQVVTFTATVSPAQGSGTPTGTVIFSDGSATLGASPLDANGQARFSTPVLDIGTHTISAAYSGDNVFASSSSPILIETVSGALQTWRGGAAGDPTSWSNPANWLLGVIPEATDTIFFAGGSVGSTTAVVDSAFGGVVSGITLDPSWSGTISVNRSLTISNGFNVAGGSWKGDGAVTVGGLSQWTGGTISLGIGGLTNNGTIALAASNSFTLAGRGTLVNRGAVNQSANTLFLQGDGNSAVTLDNQGSYTLIGDGSVDGTKGGAGAIVNEGTFAKASGTGSSLITAFFDNRGSVKARTGTLNLSSVAQLFGGTLTGGTWSVTDPASLILNNGTPITTNNATVVLDGPNALFLNLNSLAANSGRLSFLDGQTFSTNGDFSNSGTLTIGASSVFTVSGNYNQDPLATLEVQVAGSSSSGQFGQLNVAGTASLAGTLTVTLLNGFVPQSGDSYTLVTYASRGNPPTSFANGPAGFNLNYNDGNGTLMLNVP
ncbi:MAG TPA: kelch repeat-containing protein [Gemmataceae bacterium]|nr:kelch repeat-containing protein [Gemmataceae bacterium]